MLGIKNLCLSYVRLRHKRSLQKLTKYLAKIKHAKMYKNVIQKNNLKVQKNVHRNKKEFSKILKTRKFLKHYVN